MLAFRKVGRSLGCTRIQFPKELADVLPDFGSARKSTPVATNQADQFVTLVDRGNKVLVGVSCVTVPQTIDEQAFDVWLQACEDWIGFHNLGPGCEAQERFGRTGWTGIDGHHALGWCAIEEEGHVDRNEQIGPHRIGERKIPQHDRLTWNTAVLGSTGVGKENRARLAGTGYAAAFWLYQVLMHFGQLATAQLATLDDSVPSNVLSQGRQRGIEVCR